MDYIIGGFTTVLLLVYLVYALLKPEKVLSSQIYP